jgi:uncharacterized protein YjbI with pentapeptide repeats
MGHVPYALAQVERHRVTTIQREFLMRLSTLLIATSLIAVAAVTGALAFDKAKYQAIKDGQKACQWCDLSGANLANLNLTGADLVGANLTGAILTNVDFTKADLTGADLTGVDLTGAILKDAKVTGVDLDEVDLTVAKLKGANLEKANCNWATKLPQRSSWICVGVTIERK